MKPNAYWLEQWQIEENQPFTGWDFSYLDGRMTEDPPPWSYPALCQQAMRRARSALDLGTGGGERLLELRADWPARMEATEEYPPNLRLATQRLSPLGVKVQAVPLTRSAPLPYADGEYDLVINRHSAFNSREVARILADGGQFLTQQVDGRFAADLMAVFGAAPQWPDATLANSSAWLTEAGLHISMAQEFFGPLTFGDVGAIVYYLRAVPWLVPGFSVATHADGLLALQARLGRGQPLRFTGGKFLIAAQK